MPTYCYKVKSNGDTFEQFFPVGKAPKHIDTIWGIALRDFSAERKGVPPTKGWPLTCFASGVNAADADKLRQEFINKGVPTEVTSDGDPVYRDASHRRKALKARGFFDRSAYI